MVKIKAPVPRSVTSFSINLLAVVAYMITIYFLRKNDILPFWGVIICIAILTIVIGSLEKIRMGKIHKISSGIDFTHKRDLNAKRVLIKLLGLYFTVAIVVLCYRFIPVYGTGMYRKYFEFALKLLPIILIGSIPYFFLLDRYMKEPRDSHWHVGMLLLGKSSQTDRYILKNHFLGWVVKAFFLAIMIPALLTNTGIMMNRPFMSAVGHFPSFYDYIYNFLFSIDLVFVCAGYLMTLKIFDSHIRSVEPSILGWLVALQCYQPFWNFTNKNYFRYEDGYYWGHMVGGGNPNLYKIYGIVILLLLAVYTLSSVAFGLRFSNLTNRGIITNGPYRWMKHPAYVTKNLAWWLISVPFISTESWEKALQHSLLLLALNAIYYLRAITEERHLSLDPIYVKYANAMNERGVFKKLFKIAPFLKYNENRYIKEGKVKKLWF